MSETNFKSIPASFMAQMKAQLGESYPAFQDSLTQAPNTSLRKNLRKPSEIFPESSPVPWCDTGIYLKERPRFVRDPLIHAGAYYVQEASSMILSQLLPKENDIRVLDLCAAPGGKSTLIASHLNGEGLLVSNEMVSARAKVLAENMSRWGAPNVVVTQNRPSDFSSLRNYFDAIIVDAPCSGEGMFRKEIKSIEQWTPNYVAHCHDRQEDILTSILPALALGGRLIYSTCTYNAAENENIVEWLLEQGDGALELVDIQLDESWGWKRSDRFPETYHAYPHSVKGEGFFFAVLQKTGELNLVSPKREKSKHKFKKKHKGFESKPAQVSKQEKLDAQNWLQNPKDFVIEIHKGDLVAIPKTIQDGISDLSHLYIHKKGIHLGQAGKNTFIPNHDLAMSWEVSDEAPRIQLSYEEAIHYLKRESMSVPEAAEKGWAIVQYEGVNLGWVKVLDNRMNNHLPKSWRIRADISDW